jgi:hypothetical protein
MRPSLLRITAAGALAVATALLTACSGEVEPEIARGIDGCRQCGMVIDQTEQACGYVADGEFVTFDSPTCLLKSYEARGSDGEDLPQEVYFADYGDSSLCAAEEITFLLTDHVPTVMESGALCFASPEAAEAARQHEDELLTDWEGFQVARGVPDRVIEVQFDARGMAPEVVESAKGELLLWKIRAGRLEGNISISIKGYPEVGTVTVPASGDEVIFRMKALRPGAGFPVVRADSGEALGALKVLGPHTADEEAL